MAKLKRLSITLVFLLALPAIQPGSSYGQRGSMIEGIVAQDVAGSPERAEQIVADMVRDYPDRAVAIVRAAINAAPRQVEAIVRAAVNQVPYNQAAPIAGVAATLAPNHAADITKICLQRVSSDQSLKVVDAVLEAAPGEAKNIVRAAVPFLAEHPNLIIALAGKASRVAPKETAELTSILVATVPKAADRIAEAILSQAPTQVPRLSGR